MKLRYSSGVLKYRPRLRVAAGDLRVGRRRRDDQAANGDARLRRHAGGDRTARQRDTRAAVHAHLSSATEPGPLRNTMPPPGLHSGWRFRRTHVAKRAAWGSAQRRGDCFAGRVWERRSVLGIEGSAK